MIKYILLLFTLLFHTIVYSQLNTSNRTVNQKLNFKAGANFNSLTASTLLTLDGSKDLTSSSVTTTDLAFIDNLLGLDTAGSGLTVFNDGTDAFSAVTITGTAGETTVLNGDGTAGNPTIGIADNPVLPGTEGVVIPNGTTAQRPASPGTGELRWNTTETAAEIYDGTDWSAVGGGLGSAQTISIVQADDDSTDFSGNNATFDGGGTINGSITENTTSSNFLTGEKKVYFYDASATPQNDYFGWTRNIPQGWRGRTIAYEFTYRTDSVYQNGDIVWQIKDNTNGDLLIINGLPLDQASNANGNGETIRGLVNIPEDAASLDFGFQVTGTTASFDFFVDKISLDIDDFNYKNVSGVEYYSAWNITGLSSNNTAIPYATNERANTTGTIVTITNNSSDGFFIKANKKCKVTANATIAFTSNRTIGWSLNPSDAQKDTRVPDVNAAILHGLSRANTTIGETTVTIELEVGDELYFHVDSAGTVSSSGLSSINVTASAESKHVVVDSGDAESIEIYFDGYAGDGSTNTKIPYFTNGDTASGGEFLTIENSSVNGFSITAKQRIEVNITFMFNSAATTDFAGISLNSTQLTTNIDGITPNDQLATVRYSSTNDFATMTVTKVMEAGDVIRPHTQGQGVVDATEVSFRVVARKATQGEYHLVPVQDQFSAHVYADRQNNFWDTSGVSPDFDINLLEGDIINNVFEVVDNFTTSGGNSTIFRCLVDCDFNLSATATHSAAGGVSIRLYKASVGLTSTIGFDQNQGTDNRGSGTSASGHMQAGDYVYVFPTDVRSTRLGGISFWAKPRTEKVFIGNVPLNYTQTKYYNGTASNNAVVIQFNNLVVGRLYRVDLNAHLTGTTAGGGGAEIEHNAVIIGKVYHDPTTSAGFSAQTASTFAIFEAVASTVEIRADMPSGTVLSGNGTGQQTYATITELNHTQKTTRF